MVQTFLKIFDYFRRNTRSLYLLLTLCVILLAGGLFLLHFDEDVSGFLATGKEHERIGYAYRNIGGSNKIIVSIAMTDQTGETDHGLLMDAADHLAGLLEKEPARQHIKAITYKADPALTLEVGDFVTSHMPYFLEEEDYVRIDSLLQPQVMEQQIIRVKQNLLSPAGMMLRNTLLTDPLLFSGPLLQRLEGFKPSEHFTILSDYLFSGDGNEAVLTIESHYPPGDTGNNKKLIKAIGQAIEEILPEFDNKVSVTPFGASYIAQTNAQRLRKDTWISVAIALVIIGFLLAFYFRNARQILLIGASILAGSLFAFSLAGVLTSSLSLIAIGAGSVIVGIAVNYPLHFLSHIREGYTPRQTLADIVSPLTTGNITTVGAFLSLLFLSSPAMRGFGLFASLLLLGTILFVLVFLPHMVRAPGSVSNTLNFGRLADSSPERNRWIVLALLIVTIVLWVGNKGVVFNADMQSINYMTPVQRESMEKLLNQTQGSQHVLYYVSEGTTLDEALTRYEASRPQIEPFRQSGIGSFLPSRSMRQERIDRWNDFWSTRKGPFLEQFNALASQNGFREGSFARFEEILERSYPTGELNDFGPVLNNLAANYISEKPGRSLVYTMLHINAQDAPVIEAELSTPGSPAFAFDTGSVTRLMISSLSSDFDYVLWICGFIVFLFLTLSFGRFELSVIAFLPLAISWIWILGIMSLLGLEFNIVNIILATFIFGLGDDYTIFITEGMMHEYAYGKKMLSTYKNTVALSALIMLAGIGSLIVARHPAMRSLAQVTIVGMISVVITSYIVPAYLFRKLVTKRGHYRKTPLTLWNMWWSFCAFTFFLLGVVFLSLSGAVLVLLGRRNEKNKLRFHRILQKMCRYVITHIPQTPFQLLNYEDDDFSRPSVIIANHQSHLDLMAIIMLHPKIVVMTNNREWNSPFYNIILRFADYLPIETLNTRRDLIHERVSRGYSVMIFPEGTRSADCSILRFHKGAFHLAEDLGLDITPVLLHGFGHVLPKEDLLLRKGKMTVKILPRIKASDLTYGTTYQERAKAVRQLFIREYDALCTSVQDAAYFAPTVLHNYLYKGRDVYASVHRSMQKNSNFAEQIEALPVSGVCYLEDHNRGEFALTASLVRRDLKIIAYIADAKKRELAAHCISVPENLTYTDTPETDEQ
ncbi:MAG: MMPL family transporter [Bacteroidales bacterium]|jgi:1-acyl-sn-glycerol-3-phosphate acyltransferase|nr:MMPL family transporter [Bacteroidales bacterium]